MSGLYDDKRLELKEKNRNAPDFRMDESIIQKMDGSLKKANALIKKLKAISPDQTVIILQEISKTKLTKYIEEAVNALLENRFQTAKELYAVLEVATVLNINYHEFHQNFNETLKSIVKNIPKTDIQSFELKLKYTWRFMLESYLIGLFDDVQFVLEVMSDFLNHESISPQRVSILCFWVKYFKGILASNGETNVLKAELKLKFSEVINGYFKEACRILVRMDIKLKTIEKKGKHYYENRGDLSENQEKSWKTAKESFDDLLESLKLLSAQLDLPVPEFEQSKTAPTIKDGKIVFADLSARAHLANISAFDSEEDRILYEDILPLSERVPSDVLPAVTKELVDDEDLSRIQDLDPDSDMSLIDTSADSKSIQELMSYIDTIFNSSMSDKASVDFCFIKAKGSCKIFPQLLIDKVKKRPDLTPFVGRFLANIKAYYPDVINEIVNSVIGQFFFLLHKRDPIRVTRARICRLIGELTKFKVMSQGQVFSCLRRAVDDFIMFNVDMVCMILESCGRFLSFQPESHVRIEKLKEIIIRKKTTGNLDQNRILMIENALFLITPQELRPSYEIKPKSEFEQYLTFLVHSKLPSSSTSHIFEEIRKLPLKNSETRSILCKVLLNVWKIRESSIPAIAAIVGGIGRLHPDILVEYLDNLSEEFLISLDLNLETWSQRRICLMKLIGELFNFSVLDTNYIFDILSTLLTYGHKHGIARVSLPSRLDPPNDLFRITLVCTLLQSIGEYFCEGENGTLMDQFLISFQYYICTKSFISFEIETMIEETFEGLHRILSLSTIESSIPALLKISKADLSFLLEDIKFFQTKTGQSESLDFESPTDANGESVAQDEFDKELSLMLSESVDLRKLDKKPQNFEFIVPRAPQSSDSAPLALRLLSKKKNKAFLKELNTSLTDDHMKNVIEGQEEEIKQLEAMKMKMLNSLRHNDQISSGPSLKNPNIRGLKFTSRDTKSQPKRRFYNNLDKIN